MSDVLILIGLLIVIAYFSASEIALFSVSEAKLRSLSIAKSRVATQVKRVLALKKRPQKLLVTLLIGTTLANMSAAAVATALAIHIFGNVGIGIATVGMTLVVLVIGEIIPKAIGQQHPATVARWVSILTLGLVYVLTPLSFVLEIFVKAIHRLGGGEQLSSIVSEEEVKALVNMSSESGSVEPAEREMIENIFNLNDINAEDAMTQTTDMVALNIALPADELLRIVLDTSFSRYPVYAGNIDHIEGVLYTKDLMAALLTHKNNSKQVKLKELIRPAMFVPEQKPLDDLLRSFQQQKKHIALVVNEYGETRGLVTLEDILEKIVGDIDDEQDSVDLAIHKINGKTIVVDADVDIIDIQKILQVELVQDNQDLHKNIAWLILTKLGDVPVKGDELTINNVKLIIEEAESTKIKRIKLIKIR